MKAPVRWNAPREGGLFLESGKYVLAMQEYEELLKGLKGMEPSFLGKVYHNCGVAQAKLFLLKRRQLPLNRHGS